MMALPPPFRLAAFDCIDSTNDEVRRRADSGEGPNLVAWAKEQTAGRGRRGRPWVSPRGNLHCSILLQPRPRADEAPQLAFVAAVALQQSLSSLLPQSPFRCKWPNDLLCNGKKVAGMLLESASPYVILGVGVNVVEAPAPALYPAVCLRQLGSGAEDFDVLSAFCEALAEWHGRWMTEGFAPIRQAWLDRAQGVGGPVTVRLADHSEQNGRFAGLDAAGALLLETSDGACRPILAGDVFFPR
ncbi:MAG TPA: biotin--[acetyl-CoA-carboxylase] ligase [Candidatus Sulfotelmatobacter sp.]|jgi:BirA family biotin operon repressor/biotin-[acetyl-CoA-carboxylase] ligase|nr:biotin--[acetyl-CoA-carboxylase] ligase [Candidatus Sulfotelmatobacter sp.]